MKPKKVKIYNIDIIDYTDNILTLEIECGSGTYIRSIGRDIANELNSLAVMTSLVRTGIDQFGLEKCSDIVDINKDNISDYIISMNDLLDYPMLDVSIEDRNKLLNGQTLIINETDGIYKLNDGDNLLALVEIKKNHAKMSIFLVD